MRLRRDSSFHRIEVSESGGIRTLFFDDTVQSTMRLDDSHSGLEYVDYFHIPLLLRDSIERTLFIGLGGATGPKQFVADYPSMSIDVVEIDPEVVRIAQRHFEFEPSDRCAVHVADGREFLAASRRRWDLIIVDAYASGDDGEPVVPPGLATVEFFELCRRRLSSAGVVVYNCASAPDESSTREIHAAMAAVFPALLAFECSSLCNVVLVGSAQPLEHRPSKLASMARRSLESGEVCRTTLMRRCRRVHRGLTRRS